MRNIDKQIRRVAPTSAAVLISGESGTGKEMVAQEIHRLSARHDKPFLAINCGTFTPQLIESELFGHAKGSFTGAIREHQGYFERADGGTLLLDEITEMPLDSQVNLLRVLETGVYSQLGGTTYKKTDIRILAATNRDPLKAVEEGFLREDLLYRIQVFPIHLPPLRERGADIILLAKYFIGILNQHEHTSKYLSEAALEMLRSYSWPGNIREMKNVIYRAHIMADIMIDTSHLSLHISRPSAYEATADSCLAPGTTLAEMEKNLILITLARCNGRREKAAKILGISPKTLYNRLRAYRLERDL